jgi:hypothetical protein
MMTRLRGMAVTLAVALGVPAVAAAQRVDPDRIIDLHVNAEAHNQSFDGSVPEGGRFRLTFAGTGTFELSPVLVNASTRTFRVTIYSGPEDAESSALRAAETVTARQGVPVAIRSMPSVSLVVDGTRRRTAAAPAPVSGFQLALLRAAEPLLFGECCVTCGLVRACGCSVTMSCGSCCADGCCPKPPIEQESCTGSSPEPGPSTSSSPVAASRSGTKSGFSPRLPPAPRSPAAES